MEHLLSNILSNPDYLFMYSALYLANLYFLYVILSYVRKVASWDKVVGIVEKIELKNVGDSVSTIPTVSYSYKGALYSSRPTGSFKASEFIVDFPVEILVNPHNPSIFSVKNNQVIFSSALVIGLINIPAIKTLLNLVM